VRTAGGFRNDFACNRFKAGPCGIMLAVTVHSIPLRHCIHGDCVTRGLWRQPDGLHRTSAAFGADSVFRTGAPRGDSNCSRKIADRLALAEAAHHQIVVGGAACDQRGADRVGAALAEPLVVASAGGERRVTRRRSESRDH
jgi:hypothetical protein